MRINNAYGLLLLRRGLFAEAEPYFRRAIDRLTGGGMFNNPYDSEPFYHLGLSLFWQKRCDEAYDAFYKATWSSEQQEMSFYFLAAIQTRRKNLSAALRLVEQGLVKNIHNVKARGLKAAILAKLGRTEEAKAWIRENLALDPFDCMSRFVLAGIEEDREAVLSGIRSLAGAGAGTYLAAARDFLESGLAEEALPALETFEGSDPLAAYYKAYTLGLLGRTKEQAEALSEAEAADPACCFPNKLEDIDVLEEAIRLNPKGAKAPYYLGCLFYDRIQYAHAAALWKKSEALDDSFPTVHRNLAIACFNKLGEKARAREEMEKAWALDPTDARILLELDQLLHALNCSPEERLALLEKNRGLAASRDDLYCEYITVLNLCGKYEEAHRAITGHAFRTWEGAEGKITTQFKTCLLEIAKKDLAAKDWKSAKDRIQEALSYPENLGEGRLEGTKDNHLYYCLGLALEQLGETEEAKACFEKATEGAMEVAGMMYYYDQPADMILCQGLALEKLGRKRKPTRASTGFSTTANST